MAHFTWDPDPTAFTLPIINHPIAWYGILFATGFYLGYLLLLQLLQYHVKSADHRVLADRLLWVMLVATVVGARLGEVFFYDWTHYREHPLAIFMTWRGGLASHGGAIAIVLAIFAYRRSVRDTAPELTVLRIFDCVVVPTALVAVFIRVGNFINQEILGTVSNVPWAVIFGHPQDGSLPAARHPAQLYEAVWYALTFIVLLTLWKKRRALLAEGTLFGLFLLSVFGFRFFIEFLKEPQGHVLAEGSALLMGQWLSIPFVVAGCWLLWRPLRVRPSTASVKISG